MQTRCGSGPFLRTLSGILMILLVLAQPVLGQSISVVTATDPGSIGDVNLSDGYDLGQAIALTASGSDTASDEPIDVQVRLLSTLPAGVQVEVEVDSAAADGGTGSLKSFTVADGTSLKLLVDDIPDNDSPGSAGVRGISVNVDLKVLVDADVVALTSQDISLEFCVEYPAGVSQTCDVATVTVSVRSLISAVTVSSSSIFMSGNATASGSVDILDINALDGLDLADAFTVTVGVSDTASADELLNVQVSLSAAAPAGVSVRVEVDTSDIPAANRILAAGGAGSASGATVLVSGTSWVDLATDLDDDDTVAGPPAGNTATIVLPVDLKVDVDGSVGTASSGMTLRFRALYE